MSLFWICCIVFGVSSLFYVFWGYVAWGIITNTDRWKEGDTLVRERELFREQNRQKNEIAVQKQELGFFELLHEQENHRRRIDVLIRDSRELKVTTRELVEQVKELEKGKE